jgi:glycosyltransferase involved in cell wall biosynthesis
LARTKGLANVLFIEPQPEKFVPLIWASASIGAITYRKGLADFSVPSKLLACMCAQRPAIAAADKESATSKLISKAGCGLSVAPESPQSFSDCVLWMKHNPLATKRLAENGRKYAENYLRREYIVGRYESFFYEVAKC